MQIGQRVICINDKYQDGATPCVVEGKIYVVRGVRPVTNGLYLEGIYLDIIQNGVERAFLRSRFREIDDGFAEEVLRNVLVKVKEEERTLAGFMYN